VLDGAQRHRASASKMAGDLRLLQHEGELIEPSSPSRSAPAPWPTSGTRWRAERITGLARFVISLQANGAHTAASQWLEPDARR